MMMQKKMELIRQDFEKTTGFSASVVYANKNGVDQWGLRQNDCQSFSPIVYLETGESSENFICRTESIFRNANFYVDIDVFKNRYFILNNCYVGIQRTSKGNYITKKVLDLQAYVYVVLESSDNNFSSTKVNAAVLSQSGLSWQEVWNAAVCNMQRIVKVACIEEFFGFDANAESLFDTITSTYFHYGAGALAVADVFKQYCQERNLEKVLILPSSIHELLILKDGVLSTDYQYFADLVNTVNNECVKPEEQLNAVVYLYTAATNTISIVAEAM